MTPREPLAFPCVITGVTHVTAISRPTPSAVARAPSARPRHSKASPSTHPEWCGRILTGNLQGPPRRSQHGTARPRSRRGYAARHRESRNAPDGLRCTEYLEQLKSVRTRLAPGSGVASSSELSKEESGCLTRAGSVGRIWGTVVDSRPQGECVCGIRIETE